MPEATYTEHQSQQDCEVFLWWYFADRDRRWLLDLESAGVATLADLKRSTDAELLAFKGLGPKALAELRDLQRNLTSKQMEAAANG
jgi:DNA-binding MarR family transcriptional regulator